MLTGKINKFQRPEQMSFAMAHELAKTYLNHVGLLRSAESRKWRFDDYFTFMFVREPLERLLSAYRFVFLDLPFVFKRMDIPIVRKYRPREYKASVKRYNVTFAEFVRWILDEHAAGHALNRHWIPQYKLCRVCQTRYDFIGHYETLHKDADYVVDKLKSRLRNAELRRRVDHVKFPPDNGRRKSSELLQQMYASVPAAQVQALYTNCMPSTTRFSDLNTQTSLDLLSPLLCVGLPSMAIMPPHP